MTLASAPLQGRSRVCLADLRPHQGATVHLTTRTGALEGVLLSCTSRSAWVVAADEDHVLPLGEIMDVTGPR